MYTQAASLHYNNFGWMNGQFQIYNNVLLFCDITSRINRVSICPSAIKWPSVCWNVLNECLSYVNLYLTLHLSISIFTSLPPASLTQLEILRIQKLVTEILNK